MGKAEEFETGHQDRVTVLHTNFNGTRILTASIDHRIKVWHRDSKTGERTLIDTFTAHDADIRDVRSLPSLLPVLIFHVQVPAFDTPRCRPNSSIQRWVHTSPA